MPNDLSMIFNVIARDGASPAFRTVAAEAKMLQRAIEESDAKMTASTRAAAASVNASMGELGRAHTAAALQYDRATATEIGANDSLEASQKKLAASMTALVAEQRAAAASAVETGATIDRVAAEEAAATEASAAKRRASMMAFGAASAAALVGVAYYSVKAATSFEASMARVQTMAGASSGELKRMSDGVLALAPKVGVGPDKLAESLYHVESAGFHGAAALDMVAASAKLSAIGQDDINSSTQAVVATLASNIKGVRDANDAAAQILHTVGTGDMTMHQFTQALGTGLLATAAAVGLSFRDVGAAIATMTDNAIPADQAATKLRTSLLMMVNPSHPAIAALASIGMNATALAGDLQKPDGLKVALDDIRTHLDMAFPKNGGVPLTIDAQRRAVSEYRQELATTGVTGKELDKAVNQYSDSLKHGTTNTVLQEQAFAKMFGGSKNAGTMLVLFNEQLDRMNPKLASYGDATSRAAELQAAWAKQQDTFKQKLNDLSAAFDVMKIKIGNALLPVLKEFVGFLGSHIGLVETLAFVVGTVLVGATVAWTVALQLNPVVQFVEAIVLLGVEIYLLVTHFKEVLHWLHELSPAISIAIAAIFPFLGIPLLIFQHWQGIVDFFKGIWHGISEAFNHPGELAGKVIARVKEIPGAITTATSDAANWLWDAAKRAASGLWDGLIYGITHAFGIGKRIGKAITDGVGDLAKAVSDFITQTDWGKVVTNIAKSIADWVKSIDWGHVGSDIVNALTGAFKWAWENKKNIAKIGGIIVGGIILAVAAIPTAMLLIGGSIVAGIVTGIYQASKPLRHAVGEFFTDIWDGIKRGVGDVIGFISRHWRSIITIFMGPIGFVISLVYRFRDQVGAAFSFLWRNVSKVVGTLVRDVVGGFVLLWKTVTFLTSNAWRGIVAIAKYIWRDVSGAFSALWRGLVGIVKTMWRDLSGGFSIIWHGLVDIAKAIWRDVSTPFTDLWHLLVDVAHKIWDGVKKPFSDMWDGLKRGFDDVVSAIKTAWNKLGEIFAAPIRFLVHWVYDDGILKVWNAVMDVLGEGGAKAKPIDYNSIHFATGGVIPGNHNRDTVPFYGTPGEVVVPKQVVRRYGGPDSLMSTLGFDGRGGGAGSHLAGGGPLNLAIPGFNPNGGDLGAGARGVQGYVADRNATIAAGAAADARTPNIFAAIANLARGALADTAGPILNGALSLFSKLVPGANHGWGKASVDMSHALVNKVMDWIRGQDAKDQAAMAAMGGNDGTSAPLIIEYARRHGINVGPVTTTGGQHASGSYHYLGEAVDFGNVGNPNQRGIFDLFDAVAPSLLELFWDPAGHYVKNGQRIPGAIGGHMDHVHVAASVAAMDGLLGIPVSYASAGGLAAGGIKTQVQQAAAARGWGGMFPALDYIISHESSWNPNVGNPGSTAYGLFQLLYGGHGSVPQQIQAGFNYIAGRYGNPNAAEAFWQRNGYYANGGMPSVGESFWVGERGPELMRLGPGGAGSRVYSNEESRKMVGSGALMEVHDMHVYGPIDFQTQLRDAQFTQQMQGGF